ncbi:TetR/AcrR family transcriptional regulator [Phenylobacterium sp. LjRoot225]|uniref:TetR/AcrR family transcriptional regulator n=1 Tax=Phenylobacterium sp. LjRoot225 TaxID=3342285 RepID=UPI003ECD4D9B
MARTRGRAGVATSASASAKPGPRGRPTAERAAAIEQVIRSAALEVFLAAGFEAASMDAIAAAAQVSKGTLYARYPNKEALFLSVLQGQRERLGEQAAAFDHLIPNDLEGRLRHHARTLVRTTQNPEYQRLLQLVETNAATFPELPRLWNEDGAVGYLRLLADNMAAAASPAHQDVDWDFVANLFLHAIGGWLRTQASLQTFDAERAATFSDGVIAVVMAWIHDRTRLDTNSP